MQENISQEKWHHLVTVEDLGGLKKKLHIIYDSEGVDLAFNKATDIIAKDSKINGFRKGKTPKALVENYYKKQIKTSASTLLANEGFLHACYEKKIQPLGAPKVEDANFNIDGTFSCDIFVEVKPNIVPEGYIGLQLKNPNLNIEETFSRILNSFRLQYSYNKEKDVVEEGDNVEVDFDVKCGDEEVAAGKGHHFEIKSGMEPPFGENLLGMRVGEDRFSTYVIPDSFNSHIGEEGIVKISLKNVTTKIPASDEILVEKFGLTSFKEIEDLVRQQSINENKNRERKILEEEVVDKLLELHNFDVPDKWVEEEINYMLKQFNLNKVEEGGEFYNYIKNIAIRNVKRVFVLDAIYDSEPSLALKEEDLNELIKQEAISSGVSELTVKDRLKKKNVLAGVLGMLRQNKVLDFILKNSQIVNANNVEG